MILPPQIKYKSFLAKKMVLTYFNNTWKLLFCFSIIFNDFEFQIMRLQKLPSRGFAPSRYCIYVDKVLESVKERLKSSNFINIEFLCKYFSRFLIISSKQLHSNTVFCRTTLDGCIWFILIFNKDYYLKCIKLCNYLILLFESFYILCAFIFCQFSAFFIFTSTWSFYKEHFYKKHQAKIGKKISKS